MGLRFSPSSLSDFAKCRRCWWLDKKHKLKLPRGAFPSLPGGMDRALKVHYDNARAQGVLPSEIVGKVPGLLYGDQANLKRWRNWRTGLEVEVAPGVSISGAVDDLLEDKASGLFSMIDYKTRGAAPIPGGTEQYYQIQANCYEAMLWGNGMKTDEHGRFVYYWPKESLGEQAPGEFFFSFNVEVVTIATDRNHAHKLAIAAASVMEGPLPDGDCEVCKFIDERSERVSMEYGASPAL